MLAVECRALTRHFGEVEAVAGVDLQVQEGEFFALLGPNGAGKTTTLHMITTLLRPSGGEVRVLGFDPVTRADAVRARIGMVFQEPALDDRLSARENLDIHAALYAVPRRETRARIDQALTWAELAKAANRLVRTFSGGMKRRLELARALMHQPKILFLDEPTLGLDPQGRRNLWQRIEALRERGLTVFMTTHYLQEAEACDRVAILDQGRVIVAGSPAALKAEVLGGREGSLEDVFIALTGHELRDEEATGRERLLSFARKGGEHTR